jgi:GntR family transcriptional regulator, transcriptional repressor for pyruvate dehydrogenase complex
MLEPITRKRLSESAVESIKVYITERNLVSGDQLPTEREFGEALNISRASVREALRMLEIAGLIVVKPGSGIYFKGWTDDLSIPLNTWLPLNDETLRENYEVRQLIEPRSAYLAAERISPERIEKLTGLVEKFQQCVNENDLPGMILADTEFHKLIAQATNNKTLSLLMNTITRYLTEAWKASLRIPQRPQKSIIEHKAIYDAIKNRDPELAGRNMAIHLANAVKEIGNYEQIP